MAMTKKDYELIADAFKSTENKVYESVNDYANHLANALAHRLKIDNPRFDWDRFLEACGIESEV